MVYLFAYAHCLLVGIMDTTDSIIVTAVVVLLLLLDICMYVHHTALSFPTNKGLKFEGTNGNMYLRRHECMHFYIQLIRIP